MDSVPKLLPIWHDVTVKDYSNQTKLKDGKAYNRGIAFPDNLFPDHGGAGVDITIDGTNVECEEVKSIKGSSRYASEMCALPFMPPNKVSFHQEPCFSNLHQRREKAVDFCRTLRTSRHNMNCFKSYNKQVFSALDEMPDLVKNEKFDEILVPKSAIKLAKLFPKTYPVPLARWAYQGGCLAVSSSPSSRLLHPVGPKLSQLAITVLKETTDCSKIVSPQIKKQKKVSLKSGKIFQIVEDSNFNVCCVRNSKKYHYIKLDNTAAEKVSHSYSVESFCFEERLSDLKLSPYVPGEHVVATNSGFLFLENAVAKKRLWQLSEPLSHDPLVQDMFWWCDFGAHPRCILYSDRQCFCSLDLRSKRPKAISILSSPNPFLFQMEQLTCTRRFADVPFQHLVATDNHLFIFDERYAQQPVMSWSHMLKSVPLYCDVKKLFNHEPSSEYIVLLASQESADIVSFNVSTSSRIQPLSLSLPLHLSKPSDGVKFLKLSGGIVEDKILARLESPLTGICAVPYLQKEGYTVVQMTSFGDLFYQQFQPSLENIVNKTYKVGPGCELLSPEDVLPQMSSWMKRVNVKTNPELGKKFTFMHVNKKELFKDITKKMPSSKCEVCKTKENDKDLCADDVCPRCGLDTEFQKSLNECARKGGIMCGKLSHSNKSGFSNTPFVPTRDTDEYTDSCSQMILTAWEDMDEMNSLEAEPSKMPMTSALEDSFITPSLIHSRQSANQLYEDNLELFPSSQQSSYLSEDIIPPSQGMNSQSMLHASKKNPNKKIKFNASVAF